MEETTGKRCQGDYVSQLKSLARYRSGSASSGTLNMLWTVGVELEGVVSFEHTTKLGSNDTSIELLIFNLDLK